MRLLRFLLCALSILVLLATLFPVCFSAKAAPGNAIPSDVCSLLTVVQLKKTLGKTFDAPQKSVFPAVYMGQADGTQCNYHAGSTGVSFIFYSDHSASEAKQTFNSLTGMFPAKSKPSGIGDQAYLDNDHALHVLKANYRFFISVNESSVSDAMMEKQEEDLATAVATQL
ncbi:MAG: hypothetical protein ACRD40_11810 [Candidatus Acidiferrales bacterium]